MRYPILAVLLAAVVGGVTASVYPACERPPLSRDTSRTAFASAAGEEEVDAPSSSMEGEGGPAAEHSPLQPPPAESGKSQGASCFLVVW